MVGLPGFLMLIFQGHEDSVLGVQHKQIRASPGQLCNQRAEPLSRCDLYADDAITMKLLDAVDVSALDVRP